jgi:hypothetical protein
MATEQLKHAYETAEELPSEIQDTLAALLLQAIEEAKWEAFYAHPETQTLLETLEENVRENIRAGHILEWKPGEDLDALLRS